MGTRAAVSIQNPKENPQARVLSSWKEIAAYIGRGVRTVQRYEHSFELPVRRPNGKSRGAVYTFAEDLDEWLRTRSPDPIPAQDVPKLKAVAEVRQSIHQSEQLRLQCCSLRNAHHQVIASLVTNLSSLMENMKSGRERGSSHQAHSAS